MKAVAASVIERWLTPEFRARTPQAANSALQMLEASPPEGYVGVLRCGPRLRCAQIRSRQIRVPTLVIHGKQKILPRRSADGRISRDQIPGARYRRSRCVASFQYRSIGTILHRGVDSLSYCLDEEVARWMNVNDIAREFPCGASVLGDAHVDRALKTRTEFQRRISGFDHALCLGRNLDAARPCRERRAA